MMDTTAWGYVLGDSVPSKNLVLLSYNKAYISGFGAFNKSETCKKKSFFAEQPNSVVGKKWKTKSAQNIKIYFKQKICKHSAKQKF